MTDPGSMMSVILLSNAAAAALTLGLAGAAEVRRKAKARIGRPKRGELVFLFADETLVDATPAARRLMKSVSLRATDWQKFLTLFSGSVPNLAEQMSNLVEQGQLDLMSQTGPQIQAVWLDGVARISVQQPDTGDDQRLSKSIAAAAQGESAWLRDTLNALPALVWHEDLSGNVLWANDIYLARANNLDKATGQWPPPRLFDLDTENLPEGGSSRRMSLTEGEGDAWFDVHAQPLDGRIVLTAVSAARVVAVEKQRREFMQTLTKTFSQLNFGLAVFDKSRRLGLFNPALTQMTRLDVEFLASRPTLTAFLDKLREKRIIPEPRDYAAWRAEITDAALVPNGCYDANWLLASGQTYHICGRAHADGSFALTFEDVSKEVSLTRRHRAELDVAQSALDSLDQSICSFDRTGALVLSNRAFDALWGVAPDAVLGQITILDMLRTWQSKCLPSPIWGEIRDLVMGQEPRGEWSGFVTRADGQCMAVTITPAAQGNTTVTFAMSEVPHVTFETHRRRELAPLN